MTHTLLRLQQVSKALGGVPVLHDVSLQLNLGEKVGLIGNNGAGKTTLLNMMAGLFQPDGGWMDWADTTCRVHYLTQSRDSIDGHQTVEESSRYMENRVLNQLGLARMATIEALDHLSGGERTKRAIADAFSQQADLMILDEPTNHLDEQGMEWLIQAVRQYPGTVLLVSHDRYFLDQTVQRIVALHEGRSRLYDGNYSVYRAERDAERAAAKHLYDEQVKEQARVSAQIDQLKQWATKAHQQAGKVGTASERRQMGLKQYQRAKAKKLDQRVKSQINRLEKLRQDTVEKPVERPLHLGVQGASNHGKWMVRAERVEKRYGERCLFQDANFAMARNDRLALIGPNGCGKTTLIRMLLGEEEATGGRLWVSPSVKVAYLAQDSRMPQGETVLAMTRNMTPDQRTSFRTWLANMGLGGDKLRVPAAELSMGEQTRVKLAWLILNEHNLLILDEPTNHLDLDSREELERVLETYEGTLLMVTHDRYLTQRLCTKSLVFQNGTIRLSLAPPYSEEEAQPKATVTTATGPSPASLLSQVSLQEELMVVETRIANLLGELSQLTPEQPLYQSYDVEFHQCSARRRELLAMTSKRR